MAAFDDPDEELLARLGRGEPQAARDLVARKLPRVLALAQRLLGQRAEAEDVAQEAFLRVWTRAADWRTGEARFDTWLHRVVLNLCHDRLRAPRQRHEQAAEELPEVPDRAATPEARYAGRRRSEQVGSALAALPPRQREALVLFHYQELPQAEIAELMGLSVDALESLLARARRSLRAQLTEEISP